MAGSDTESNYECDAPGPSTENGLRTEIVHTKCSTTYSRQNFEANKTRIDDDHIQKPLLIIGVRLNKAPKTSAERGREFRARKAMLKHQNKQQQPKNTVDEISTEDIQSADPSQMNIIEKRARSAEATRRWREKRKGVRELSKRQAKTAAQRMREYRERKKLAKKILKQQSGQENLYAIDSASTEDNERAGPSAINSVLAELTRMGSEETESVSPQPQRQNKTAAERMREYRARRNENINIESIAKLRAEQQTSTSGDSEPSTSTATTNSEMKIEHVDLEQFASSAEETEIAKNPPMEFLPENEIPSGSTLQEPKKSVVHKDTKAYCRLCLNSATRNQMVCLGDFHDINYPSRSDQFKRNKVLQTEMYLKMIKMLMPDFEHDLVFNPIMCNDCSNRLQQASDFVEKCMSNQKLMQLYRTQFCPSERMISCEDFVQNKSKVEKMANQPPAKKRKINKSPAGVQLVQEPSTSVSRKVAVPSSEIPTAALVIKPEIEDYELETKYEITTEEIIQIKQEIEPAEENCNSEDDSEKDIIVKNELRLPDVSCVIKNEPHSPESFPSSNVPSEVNLPVCSPNSVVGAAAVPLQFCSVPVRFCPPLQPMGVPQTFVSVVNPVTAVSSTFSSTENKTGDFRDNSND